MEFLEGSAYDAGRKLYTSYQTIISLDAILVCVQSMRFVAVNSTFGVLILMLLQMVVDVGVFLVLFLIVTLGFTVTLVGLQLGGSLDFGEDSGSGEVSEMNFDINNAKSGLWSPLWATFGSFDPVEYDLIFSVIM